mmetsp:Transcript_131878/g.239804  ORF Transcript_131878/g.239804 Transcript_131878/m.239804 type:complete len:288 (-) Transcript_131878:16-879(-)
MQSLQELLRIANRVDRNRRTVYIQLLEDPFPDEEVLSAILNYLTVFFRLPLKVTYTSWQVMGLQTRPGRGGFGDIQLSMDDLLFWLKRNVPDDAYCIAAITMIDLFVPSTTSWDYIPGRSHYTQRHGACSLSRLRSEVDWKFEPCSRGKFLRRCFKLTSHEVAHMFGLKHCVESTCRMAGTMSLEHHDATTLFFCSNCEAKLHRVSNWSSGDMHKRAQNMAIVLANCCTAAEFEEEVAALRSRGETAYKSQPIMCSPCMKNSSEPQRGVREASLHRPKQKQSSHGRS